jgi:RNA polymerase sigma factor (sigma-70 family)
MGISSEQVAAVYERRVGGFTAAVAAMLDDAEGARDVVQDAFARALVQRRRCRGSSPEAWVWRIVERRALDELRQRGRTPAIDHDFEAGLVPAESNPRLAAAVRALPPRRRLVVFLRYFADLEYADIARVCGISEGTVAATLAQAQAELRQRFEHEEVPR